MSSSVGKKTLKFSDVKYLTLSKEIRRRKLGLTSRLILNTANSGRSTSKQPTNYGRSKFKGKSKACWNYDHCGYLRADCQAPKKTLEKDENKQSTNVTEEIKHSHFAYEQSSGILNFGL